MSLSSSESDEAMASVELFSSPTLKTPSWRTSSKIYILPSVDAAAADSPEEPSPLAKYSSRLKREGAFYLAVEEDVLAVAGSPVDTELDDPIEADDGDDGMNDLDDIDATTLKDAFALFRSPSNDNMSTDSEASVEAGIEFETEETFNGGCNNATRRLSVRELLNPEQPTEVEQSDSGFPALMVNQPEVWSLGEKFKKAFCNLVPGLNIPLPAAFDPEMLKTHLRLELAVRGKTKFSGITADDFFKFCVQCNQCLRYFSRRTHEFHVFPGPCLGEEGFFNPDFEFELQRAGIDIADPEPRWPPTYICKVLYTRFHGVRVFEGITQEEFDFLWVRCFGCGRIMLRDAAYTHICDASELHTSSLDMENED